MKVNKDTYVKFLVELLEQGFDRKAALAKCVKKWQTSVRTFDRWWKAAILCHGEAAKARHDRLLDLATEADKERFEKGILTKHDRMLIASNIAKGIASEKNGEYINPSHADQMKALDYLSKIDGDYAAVKADITSKGEKIEDTRPMVELPDGTIIHI